MEHWSKAIKAALDGRSVQLALDTISASSSEKILGRVLDTATGAAKIATFLPLNPAEDVQGIKRSFAMSTLIFGDSKQAGVDTNANRWLGATVVTLIEMAIGDGSLKRHPYEVIEGGLNGIETGLRRLQSGSSTVKLCTNQLSRRGDDHLTENLKVAISKLPEVLNCQASSKELVTCALNCWNWRATRC